MLRAERMASENRLAVMASGLEYAKIKNAETKVPAATESQVLSRSNSRFLMISMATIAMLNSRKFIPADCL